MNNEPLSNIAAPKRMCKLLKRVAWGWLEAGGLAQYSLQL